MPEQHLLKPGRGGVNKNWKHFYLSCRCRWVVSFALRPFYARWKAPPPPRIPFDGSLDGYQSWSVRTEGKERRGSGSARNPNPVHYELSQTSTSDVNWPPVIRNAAVFTVWCSFAAVSTDFSIDFLRDLKFGNIRPTLRTCWESVFKYSRFWSFGLVTPCDPVGG